MNESQKQEIISLRKAGNGYKKIASILGLSTNTVKSFCQRQNVGGVAAREASEHPKCLYCGVPVAQNPGRKQKKFCSDNCRMKWWNSHQELVKHKKHYDYVCPVCGQDFTVYGNAHRKYCSHDCYIIDRFGAIENEEK